jgi:hypothetical protein
MYTTLHLELLVGNEEKGEQRSLRYTDAPYNRKRIVGQVISDDV